MTKCVDDIQEKVDLSQKSSNEIDNIINMLQSGDENKIYNALNTIWGYGQNGKY